MKRRHELFQLARGAALLVVLAALVAAVHIISPAADAEASTLRGLGLLLFGGYLAAHLGERIGLPHVTGYLLAGLVLGPHSLNIIDLATVERLRPTNAIALALIALSAGAELRFELLRREARQLAHAVLAQLLIVLPGAFLTLLALKRFVPFAAPLTWTAAAAAALLWGTVMMSRSPSSTLGVINELRPEGPLMRQVLSVVITMDLVVLIAFAVMRVLAGALLDPSGAAQAGALGDLGTALLGSIACGTTLGIILAIWLRLIRRQLLLFLLASAYAGTELAQYFRFEPLLLFLTAGFVAANVARVGEELLDVVGAGGEVVFVVFFALAGAHLDLPLVARLWPLALALWLSRAIFTLAGANAASRLAGDPPLVRRFGGLSIFAQAGTSISLATAIGERFPTLGTGFASLAIAVVGLNELVGPVLFKWTLSRAGEVSRSIKVDNQALPDLAGPAARSQA